MPRPLCCRRVSGEPPSKFFKPQGIPLAVLEAVTLTVDEFEAVRLADLEGLYQGEQIVGWVGALHPHVLQQLDIAGAGLAGNCFK